MEENLLPRIASGDDQAVEACLDRYGGLVWGIARRLGHSEEDAADVAQEVFLEITQKAQAFDERFGSERAFVATLARRRSIDRWRRVKHHRKVASLPASFDPASLDQRLDDVETSEEARRAWSALQDLESEQRQSLYLSIHHGWPHARIAEHLGKPLGTIKSHIRRGLMRLRSALEAGEAATTKGGAQ